MLRHGLVFDRIVGLLVVRGFEEDSQQDTLDSHKLNMCLLSANQNALLITISLGVQISTGIAPEWRTRL